MGRYNLGLAEHEFWNLTLKELNALLTRHGENSEWLNYRAALICSVLANTARDSKRKPTPYTPNDFMPGGQPKQRTIQTPHQMLAKVKILNAAFGGKIMEK